MGFQAMASKTATRGIELEPIDRLEEKLKRLVGMVERMQGEQARAAEENQRLGHELDAMRARLATSDSLSNELSTSWKRSTSDDRRRSAFAVRRSVVPAVDERSNDSRDRSNDER